MGKIGDQAVVLGASMAGLLAARVLADADERVTGVRMLPAPPVSRRASTPTWPRPTPPGAACDSRSSATTRPTLRPSPQGSCVTVPDSSGPPTTSSRRILPAVRGRP